jgi:leucyl-tRNA synthetase
LKRGGEKKDPLFAKEGGGGVKVGEKAEKLLHRLIKKITDDIENFHFNTAVSAFMEFHNQVKDERVTKEYLCTFLKLLYPFAPHIAEELNFVLGNKRSLQLESWPKYDETKIIESVVDIIVQINGKVRGKIQAPANAEEDDAKAKALELPAVKQALMHESVKRVVYVKGRLINLVI